MRTRQQGCVDSSKGGANLAIVGMCLILAVLLSGSNAKAAAPTPSRILVVYNANYAADADGDGVQDSLEVANYYVAKRGVPASNVLGLSCTNAQSGYYFIGEYPKFNSEVVQPIKAKLATLGPTNIDVILLC